MFGTLPLDAPLENGFATLPYQQLVQNRQQQTDQSSGNELRQKPKRKPGVFG